MFFFKDGCIQKMAWIEISPKIRKDAKIHFANVFHAQRSIIVAVIKPKTSIPDKLSKGKCRMVRKEMMAMEIEDIFKFFDGMISLIKKKIEKEKNAAA